MRGSCWPRACSPARSTRRPWIPTRPRISACAARRRASALTRRHHCRKCARGLLSAPASASSCRAFRPSPARLCSPASTAGRLEKEGGRGGAGPRVPRAVGLRLAGAVCGRPVETTTDSDETGGQVEMGTGPATWSSTPRACPGHPSTADPRSAAMREGFPVTSRVQADASARTP